MLSLVSLLVLPCLALGSYGGCTDGITCRNVSANDLTFECRFAEPASSATPTATTASNNNVMYLHGFPEWSDMYMPIMRVFASKGYRGVACNLRGYSPGAAPADEAAYNYNTLVSDVFAIARAVNFTRFHLVGHDHGGALGWCATASAAGKASITSYTSLSIPHIDAFSAGLYGPGADLHQQMASQYFTMFTDPNSASSHHGLWYYSMGKTSGDKNSGSFDSEAAFQKALWWYNGAKDAGIMAQPPRMSATTLLEHGQVAMASLRGLWGGSPDSGAPANRPVGPVTTPSLYVCGKSDSAILCNRPYALDTKSYVKANYTYLEVDCGHSLLSCSESSETDKVIDAVVAHVTTHSDH